MYKRQYRPLVYHQYDRYANRFGNGCTAFLSGGVYSFLLKAVKLNPMKRNKRLEDSSSSNFDGDPVVDSLKLEQCYIEQIVL